MISAEEELELTTPRVREAVMWWNNLDKNSLGKIVRDFMELLSSREWCEENRINYNNFTRLEGLAAFYEDYMARHIRNSLA